MQQVKQLIMPKCLTADEEMLWCYPNSSSFSSIQPSGTIWPQGSINPHSNFNILQSHKAKCMNLNMKAE